MARSLSNILQKGISRLPETPWIIEVSGSLYQSMMKFSTTLSNDPEMHEDFRRTHNLESSLCSVKNSVGQEVKENSVVIYMKGIPELPRCGFSALAVRVLKDYNVLLRARNILENPELKNAVKSYSHWPTFPQIFIKGKFIGGSDIILKMHQTGELKEMLKDISTLEEPE